MHTAMRVHYMDNLRALAMLAGVVFHAALAYSPLVRANWPAADPGGSVAVDAIAWFLHLFRMPLFFVVAGFFAAMLVARRGMNGMFANRCARVLLPLVVFLPLVQWSMDWQAQWAATHLRYPSPMLTWMRSYLDAHGSLPWLPGWAHLWFLFYLMLFTVLAWVASELLPASTGRILRALPLPALLLALPLSQAPALAAVGAPWPAPQFLFPALWALAYFGSFFALGYLLYGDEERLERLRPCSLPLLLSSLAAYAALFAWTDGFVNAPARPVPAFVAAVMEACVGVWMCLWCLLAARRWLDKSRPAMAWLAGASYWVYLVHLPVLFAIQFRLLDSPLGWPARFAAATAATFAVSFASYAFFVRPTIIGRLLNGPGAARSLRAAPGLTRQA